jgi:hypothetical protein
MRQDSYGCPAVYDGHVSVTGYTITQGGTPRYNDLSFLMIAHESAVREAIYLLCRVFLWKRPYVWPILPEEDEDTRVSDSVATMVLIV